MRVIAAVFCGLSLLAADTHAQMPPAGGSPAAGPGRITGNVTGAEAQPLGNVGVTILAASDSAMVTGVLTNPAGQFRVEGLPLGRYLIRVSTIGYLPRSSEVLTLTPDAPAVDLGRIELTVSALALDELRADAERDPVVIEADRTVYNVRSMPIASSGTATDVLRALSELEVDVNNNVRLRGNQAVAVHINGRPTPMRGEQLSNFLQQLPGNRIARVEVMPNPSARHDPEGMGGIVNIVLRDDLDLGLSGSVSVNTSTRNRQFANTRINYQRGRLTLFTGLGANISTDRSTSYDLRQNLVAQPVSLIEQTATRDMKGRGWNVDWTAELRVGEQATLWSNAWMFGNESDMSALTNYDIMDEARTVNERYDRDDARDASFFNYNWGFGFKQVFERQREELTIDGRITMGGSNTESLNSRFFHLMSGQPVDMPLELTLNEIDSSNGNYSIQADYFRPLRGGRFEIGYRAWLRDQDNDNLLRIFETPQAVDPRARSHSGYEFQEVFHSLYGTWARTVGRFGFQGGLRSEFASTQFDSRVVDERFETTYNTLFPSFNVSFTPQQGRTVRFLYSKRINRPPPFYLDPFVPATDPLNRFFGNPELRPSYMQSFSMDFSYTGSRGTFRVGPYYRETTDIWERIRTVDTDGVATSRWENGRSAVAYGSNFTISLRPQGRLSGSTTFSVYRDVRDGTNIAAGLRRSAIMWSLGGNMGLRVREGLTAQASANHFPTQSILQGTASGYTFTNLALRQQVGGTRGSVSLSVSDPLKLLNFTSDSRDATFIQTSRSSQSMRVASIGFTYNFGRPPQQQSRRSGPEDSGETIRIP